MVLRLFLVYVVAELAVVVALVSTIGLGWTLLVLLAAFALGLTLAGSQLTTQLNRLRAGVNRGRQPIRAVDSVAVAVGTLLVVVPGLLTSAAGLLLLLPPTRSAARPLLGSLAVRGLGRWAVPPITVTDVGGHRRQPRPDYVDGEVIDVTEAGTPVLPRLRSQ